MIIQENLQGLWRMVSAFDADTISDIVVVLDEAGNAMVLGHVYGGLAAQTMFQAWLNAGDAVMRPTALEGMNSVHG